MSVLVGTRELGLEVSWRFGFVKHGEHAATTPGVVYVDVGGTPAPGVVDHHIGDGLQCAAEVVAQRPELVYNHLLGPVLAKGGFGVGAPGSLLRLTVVTHESPDWDGVVATHLIMRLVEDGELPAYANALACYARTVDQGLYQIDLEREKTFHAPHLLYLAIQHTLSAGSDANSLQRGLALLERCVDDVQASAGGKPIRDERVFFPSASECPSADWWEDNHFADARQVLEKARDTFRRDMESRDGAIDCIMLPAADNSGDLKVPAFVATREPESVLDKYLVRAAGYPFFICPRGHRTGDGEGQCFPRVVLSLDPAWRDAHDRRPSLRGLGPALERAEAAARRQLHKGRDNRTAEPRYSDGSTDNDDPWYDGRAHEWTIVDAPREGTVLPYQEVVRIATEEAYWEAPLHAGELVFVWPRPSSSVTGDSRPVPRPPTMSETLSPLYKEICEVDHMPIRRSEIPDELLTPEGVTITRRLRRFPGGTAPEMEIVTFVAGCGTTFEALMRAAVALLEREGGAPGYRYANIEVVPYAMKSAAILPPLAALGFDVTTALSLGGQSVFLDGRSLLTLGAGDRSPISVAGGGSRVDLEVLLYIAFLNEALGAYSERIGEAVPEHGQPLAGVDTHVLREDVLRFQARHYQLEVSNTARSRRIFAGLAEATRLEDHYQEVLSELDRLSDLEHQVVDARTTRAERVLTLVLYALAAVGVYQTVIAFATLPNDVLQAPLFWFIVGVVAAILIVCYKWIERIRRSPS